MNVKCLQMKITLGTHSSYHTMQRKYWSTNVLLCGVEERSLLGWKVTSHTMPVYKETSPRAVPHKSPLGWSAWKGTLWPFCLEEEELFRRDDIMFYTEISRGLGGVVGAILILD